MPRHTPVSPSCVGCRLRAPACICDRAPRLILPTQVALILHAIERGRSSNTGSLIRLALADSEIHVHGAPGRAAPAKLDGDFPSTLVLFPAPDAQPLTAEWARTLPRPIRLLVPDGNWNQARTMIRRVPLLSKTRVVRVEDVCLGASTSRHNHDPSRGSTFEAIARALGAIEGREVERRLVDFFLAYHGRKLGLAENG